MLTESNVPSIIIEIMRQPESAICWYYLTALLFFSMVGIHYEPEFGTPALFVKSSPSIHVIYHNPIGDSDLTLDQLSSPHYERQVRYDEEVKGYYNRPWYDALAPVFWMFSALLLSKAILDLLGIRPPWNSAFPFSPMPVRRNKK